MRALSFQIHQASLLANAWIVSLIWLFNRLELTTDRVTLHYNNLSGDIDPMCNATNPGIMSSSTNPTSPYKVVTADCLRDDVAKVTCSSTCCTCF